MDNLRDHLFDTIERLKDPEKPMEVERAMAICNVADKLIESAKVEVKFMEVTDLRVSGQFFECGPRQAQLTVGDAPVQPGKKRKVNGGATIV